MRAKILKARLGDTTPEIDDAVDVTAALLCLIPYRFVFHEANEARVDEGKAHHCDRSVGFHGAVDLAQSENDVREVVQRSCTDRGVEQASLERQRST